MDENSAQTQEAAGVLMSAEELEAEAVPKEDAKVRISADEGWMTVEAEVDPPTGGGRDVTLEMLKDALMRQNVNYGIDKAALSMLAAPLYDQRMVVARGTPPVDGADGLCKELFERTRTQQIRERSDGSVDYKELGLILDIPTGTVICEMTPPTLGVNGTDTRGNTLKARDGAKAVAPAGENTRMSSDESRLEAAATGNLVFRGGRFCVDTAVRFENIDTETGNVKFSGDVLVNGDVLDGFEIHSGRDVVLRGRVGNVKVVAAGNITMEKGINGSNKAEIELEGNLKAGFLENCTIRCGGKIVTGAIMSCTVECEGDVEADSGKGIIVGGKLTVFGSLKAKTIGNETSALTTIVLGVTPKLMKENQHLKEQMEDVSRHIAEMKKNVDYIERLVKDGRPVPEERLQMLRRSQIQLPMSEKKQEQLQAGITELEGKMRQVHQSSLTANLIYPPTKVSIGTASTNVITPQQRCRIYKSEAGEVVFGKL